MSFTLYGRKPRLTSTMRSPSLIHFNIRSYFVRCEKIVALQNQHKAEKELSGGVIEKDAIYI